MGFLTLTPTSPPKFTSWSSLSDAAAGSTPLPSYIPAGGPTGNGHSSFRAVDSQFLSAGARTLHVAAHQGLTLVALVKFTGTGGTFERILEGGASTVTTAGILLGRESASNDLAFKAFDSSGSRECEITCADFIVQESWMAVTVRYDGRSKFVEVRKDNVQQGCSATCSTEIADKAMTYLHVGKSELSGTGDGSAISGEMSDSVGLCPIPRSATLKSA